MNCSSSLDQCFTVQTKVRPFLMNVHPIWISDDKNLTNVHLIWRIAYRILISDLPILISVGANWFIVCSGMEINRPILKFDPLRGRGHYVVMSVSTGLGSTNSPTDPRLLRSLTLSISLRSSGRALSEGENQTNGLLQNNDHEVVEPLHSPSCNLGKWNDHRFGFGNPERVELVGKGRQQGISSTLSGS